MDGRVLRDIDVAPSIQERTAGSGGGSNQNTRRQERDPFSDLAEMKKPDTLPMGKMPGMDQSCRMPAHPRVFGSLMFTAGPTVTIRERCA